MLSTLRKRLIQKIAIIIGISLVFCILVFLLCGFLQTDRLSKEYYSQVKDSAESTKGDVYLALDVLDGYLAAANSVDDFTAEDVADLYAVYFSDAEGNAVERTSETKKSVKLEDDFVAELNSIAADDVIHGIDVPANIKDGASDSTQAYYYAAKALDGGGFLMLVKSVKSMGEEISTTFFDEVMLVDDSYTYTAIFSSGEYTQNVYGSLSQNVQGIFKTDSAFTSKETVMGESKILALSASDAKHDNIRVLCLNSSAALDSLISDRYTVDGVEFITITIIFCVCFITLLMLLMRDNGNFFLFNDKGQNYVINVRSDGKITWKNNNFREKFDVSTIIKCVSSSPEPLSHLLFTGEPFILDLPDKQGNMKHLTMNVLRYFGKFRLIGSDMTADISAWRRLSHADICDSVTDMEMEKRFVERIAEVVRSGKGISGAIALISVSNLSMLKTMLGEHSYKQVLSIYAEMLRCEFNGVGKFYIMRNGDFLMFSDDASNTNVLVSKLPQIIEHLRVPIKLNDNNIQLDADIGVVVINSHDQSINAYNLLSNAQKALENARNTVQQRYYVLYPTSFSTTRTNFTADGVVKSMVDNNEIEAYFQPQFSLTEEKIVGFEALCRITGARSAEINIAELISIAEQYGGMIDLGNFICEKALAFAADVQKYGIEVAVNVSPIQLMQPGFTTGFIDIFKKYNLERNSFNIEITEGAALYSFEEAVQKLNIIREQGVGIHIDDFGVAYSSMLHLKLLPATLIKIDKSLVDDIVDSADARSIIKNIINLAKDLRLKVIAEGVEDLAQYNVLKELDCDMIQGYYISRALPRKQALAKIREVNHV